MKHITSSRSAPIFTPRTKNHAPMARSTKAIATMTMVLRDRRSEGIGLTSWRTPGASRTESDCGAQSGGRKSEGGDQTTEDRYRGLSRPSAVSWQIYRLPRFGSLFFFFDFESPWVHIPKLASV